MDDLVRWYSQQLDEDELWALEASRRYQEQAPEGGVHWHWVANDSDEEITPDPSRESTVGEDAGEAVSLRSRETWPTSSGVGSLPQFALYADEVPSAVGGHIIRHGPARVLREIDAKRQMLALHAPSDLGTWVGDDEDGAPACRTCGSLTARFPCRTLRLLALPYTDREGYREEWRP